MPYRPLLLGPELILNNKIIKNIHKLEQDVPEDLLPIIDTLKALQNVKSSCFGPKLGETYQDDINTFEEQWIQLYRDFQLQFSNKCHVIIGMPI